MLVAGGAGADVANVAGRWTINATASHGSLEMAVQLKQEGAKLTGTFINSEGTERPVTGKVEGREVTFATTSGSEYVFNATIKANGTLEGQISTPRGDLPRATRNAAPFAPAVHILFRPEKQDVVSRVENVVPESARGHFEVNQTASADTAVRDRRSKRIARPRAAPVDRCILPQRSGNPESIPGARACHTREPRRTRKGVGTVENGGAHKSSAVPGFRTTTCPSARRCRQSRTSSTPQPTLAATSASIGA